MPTQQDVDDAKHDSLTDYDARLIEFAALQNGDHADSRRMAAGMAQLRAKRTDISLQTYIDALNDPAMQRAIDRIQRATQDMNQVARNMTTVTGFLSNTAGFLNAAGGGVSALRGF